jgi:hypothetical protein
VQGYCLGKDCDWVGPRRTLTREALADGREHVESEALA